MPLNHASTNADLTPRQFEVVGRLIVEWSNVEHLIGSILGRLLRTPDFLARVYADELMAVRSQAALDKAIAIHKERYGSRFVSEKILDEISELNTEIEKIRAKRNRLSHFCWCRSNDQTIFGSALSGHVPTSKQFAKNSMVLSLHELEQMYTHSFSTVKRLIDLLGKLPEIPE